jgi:putative ABC transport system permease protein
MSQVAEARTSMISDCRFALRLLRRHPVFTIAALSTLALGIGSTTAVYSILDAVLLKPLAFDRPERVVAVYVRDAGGGYSGVSAGVVSAVRALPAVERAAAIGRIEQNLVDRTSLVLVRGALVTREFFDVFGVRPLAGRTFGDNDSPEAAPLVIGERLWRQRFGADPSVIGRTVRLDERPATIVGVMPRTFAQPDEAAYWRLIQPDASQLSTLDKGPYNAVARVNDAGLDAARLQVGTIGGALQKGQTRSFDIVLMPPLDMMTAQYVRVLHLVMGAVVLVLLIACGNVAVLLVARTSGRARELSVREAIGATRKRLVRQLFTESILLAIGGGIAGCAVAWTLVRAVPALGFVEVPRIAEAAVDVRALGFTLLATAGSVLLFGLAPAFASTRGAIRLSYTGSTSPRSMRVATKNLIALEIALTLALSIGGALTMRELFRLVSADIGFDRHGLWIATVKPSPAKYARMERARFYERLIDRLRATAGVEGVGGLSRVPLGAALAELATVQVEAAGSRPAAPYGTRFRAITPGTFDTLRIPIVKGRDFTPEDREGNPLVAVVNEALAERLWRGADPVGQSVRVAALGKPEPMQIVGVVRNFRGSLRRPPEPEIYLCASQRSLYSMTLVVRSRLDVRALQTSLGTAAASVDTDQPLTDPTTIGALMWEATAYSRFRAVLLTVFAVLALLLVSTGIVGVISHMVVDRTQELGIRLALGATPRQAVTLVMRDLLWPLLLGMTIGIIATYNLSHVLRRFLGTQDFALTTYAFAVLGLVLLAAIAAWIPARHAGRVDPILALRAD